MDSGWHQCPTCLTWEAPGAGHTGCTPAFTNITAAAACAAPYAGQTWTTQLGGGLAGAGNLNQNFAGGIGYIGAAPAPTPLEKAAADLREALANVERARKALLELAENGTP